MNSANKNSTKLKPTYSHLGYEEIESFLVPSSSFIISLLNSSAAKEDNKKISHIFGRIASLRARSPFLLGYASIIIKLVQKMNKCLSEPINKSRIYLQD